MVLSLFDVAAFAVVFALAVWWRRRPEYHRRLMFVATCILTDAAFTRLPLPWDTDRWAYAAVDVLILAGVAADVVAARRLHPVYRYVPPVLMCGQTVALYLCFSHSVAWLRVANWILN